jgi:hypothetical protein
MKNDTSEQCAFQARGTNATIKNCYADATHPQFVNLHPNGKGTLTIEGGRAECPLAVDDRDRLRPVLVVNNLDCDVPDAQSLLAITNLTAYINGGRYRSSTNNGGAQIFYALAGSTFYLNNPTLIMNVTGASCNITRAAGKMIGTFNAMSENDTVISSIFRGETGGFCDWDAKWIGAKARPAATSNTATFAIPANFSVRDLVTAGNDDCFGARAPILSRTVTVTSAQLLALNTTSVVLVPAPGASTRALVFEGAVFFLDYNSVAYAGVDTAEDMAIKYTNGSGLQLAACETTGFLDQTADTRRYVQPYRAASGNSDIAIVANAAIVLHMLSGNIATGNSDLRIKIYYRIVEASP